MLAMTPRALGVIPAKAGIHEVVLRNWVNRMDTGLRRYDKGGSGMTEVGRGDNVLKITGYS